MTLLRNLTPTHKRLIIIFAIVLVLSLVTYTFLNSPLSPLYMCTLMGCRDSLELSLDHALSQTYTVQVRAKEGENASITCTPGIVGSQPSDSYIAMCQEGKIIFYGLSPEDVTIDISWEGGNYSTTAHPAYRSFHPNGLFCPPACRVGTLSIKLP